MPSVILAKTVKGWTLGEGFEGRNATHQIKKMTKNQLLELRERLHMEDEIPEESLEDGIPPYFRPSTDSEEHQYMIQRRRALHGFIPKRVVRDRRPLPPRPPHRSSSCRRGRRAARSPRQWRSPRCFGTFCAIRSSAIVSCRSCPMRPAPSGWIRCFASSRSTPRGQLYEPVDHDLLLSYTEALDGQLLEEGITEAGSMASWIAAGTSYANTGVPMVPFYTFYSMFGFQRIGDLAWLAADARTAAS